MSAITIENGTIKIPVETSKDDGWVILTLAPNAHLILRAEKLNEYAGEKLEKIRRTVNTIMGEPEPNPRFHPSKVRGLRELRAQGVSVSDGSEYDLKPSSVSLEKVQQGLAPLKRSLSDEIIAQRNEE